jgi:hypothetical protein
VLKRNTCSIWLILNNMAQAIDLPVSERSIVARDLAMMGITAGSLLPGLDGACEQLKERFFPV